MKLATVRTGDVAVIGGRGEPLLGEVQDRQRGRLTVSPWPNRRTCDRRPVTVAARDVLAHFRRRARVSAAETGDLALGDIRGRRFHARVTARAEQGELALDPLSPRINYFRARPRDLQTRWTITKPAIGMCVLRAPGDSERIAQ
jgi:hypothetical protein